MLLTDAARSVGIANGYHDIWGNWREAPQQTLVAALDALGFAGAPDPQSLVRSVAEWQQASARCLLPGLLVAQAGVPVAVPLAQPLLSELASTGAPPGTAGAALAGRVVLPWAIELEAGGTLAGSGEVEPDAGSFELPALPPGRHRLRMRHPLPGAEALLLVAPRGCHLPEALAHGGRQWGLAVQLYGLRSSANWGIGDFSDLLLLIDAAAALGAQVVGLNPLHALSLDRPENSSPYSAISRLFLHPMYIDPERVAGFSDPSAVRAICAALAPAADRAVLRAAERVDYAGVSRIKLPVLRALFEAFMRDEADTASGAAFREFQATTEGLLSHATFQSIQLALNAADPAVWGWPRWPVPLQDPASPEVRAWQRENAHDIAFHAFLEWQARQQWERARTHARASGVFLYGDLALGADRGGSEVWAAQADHALGMSAGCPPDDFNLQGQGWGLPPLRPDRLLATGCAPFQAAIRAGMLLFDALRLDHVMSLMRLFWIPPGTTPAAGAYVDYPFDALLAMLRIESARNRCMVIGEDLGTVPPAVRKGLQAADVLSYRLLVFERESATRFRHPDDYPRLSLASIGSHDLAPLQGWWSGDDLAQRARIGLLDADQFKRFSWDRGEARQALLSMLEALGLLPAGESADASRYPLLPPVLVDAVHSMLARAGSMWAMVHPEDAFDLVDATNLPGTTTEHPNWNRKLPVPVEAWTTHPRLQSIARVMRESRG